MKRASAQEVGEAIREFLKKDTKEVICYWHGIDDSGYRCCACWDTGKVYERDGSKGECNCIDEGIWDE